MCWNSYPLIAIFANLVIILHTASAQQATSPSIGKIVLAEVQPEEKLVDLARTQYPSPAGAKAEEQAAFKQFFANAQAGNATNLGEGDNGRDRPVPERAKKWGSIQAKWIEWLCSDSKASARVSPRGIQLIHANVVGALNLSHLKIPFPIITFECVFLGGGPDEPAIDMTQCTIRALQLQSTTVPGLSAPSLSVEKDLILYNFHSDGFVFLRNATIGGSILCDGAYFSQGTTDKKRGLPEALNLSLARVEGGVYLRRCTVLGGLTIDRARIEGTLDCQQGKFDGNAHDKEMPERTNPAIFGESMRVAGDIRLSDTFSAVGGVVIRGSTIGGMLDCHDGSFSHDRDPAIDAVSIRVGSDIFLKGKFKSHGEVTFRGASIGGNLVCDGGSFECGTGYSLDSSHPHAISELSKYQPALTVASAKIDGSILMRSDPSNGTSFIAKGDLDFIATSIGHALELASDKRLDNITRLILRDAKAQALLNRKASWPHKGKLILDGFTFSIIDKDDQHDSSIAETELHWLDRQKDESPDETTTATQDFSSQPYEQMASVLRSMGLQDDAIQVLVAKNRRFGQAEIRKDWGHAINCIRSLGMVPPLNIEKALEYRWKATWAVCQLLWKICWYYGFGLLIGYGYMPWRALILSVVLIAIGWKVFEAAHKAHRMKPTDSMPWKDAEATNDPKYPPFNAFTYALEKFVPLVKLDMGDYWVPDGKEKPGKALLGFLHIYTFAGWVLTTLWFGGLTGLLKT
jgi:hypothetical protein